MTINIDKAPSLEALLTQLANRKGDVASFSQQRPNNTTAYGAADVLGSYDTTTVANAGLAQMTFRFEGLADALKNGGELLITSTELERDVTALISGETNYLLYLYNKPPTIQLDNAVFDIPAGDRPFFVGRINLGTPIDEVSTLYVRQDGVNQQVTMLSNVLYAHLVTVGAYTPAANTVLKVTLHALAV